MIETQKFSGKQVEKAGKKLLHLNELTEDEFREVMDVLAYWRAIHEQPLKEASKLLTKTVIKYDKKALFAKRLKRHISIYFKLLRFEKMSLKSMQDLGGCRAILKNEKKLRQAVRSLKKDKRFRVGRSGFRTKDYIKRPKQDGYRSYHIVGRFKDLNGVHRNIEVQLRTRIQHYWATALEIVDLFTDQALKSNAGEKEWRDFFVEVSTQFSIMDGIHLFDTLSEDEQLKAYIIKIAHSQGLKRSAIKVQRFCKTLNIFDNFTAFAQSLRIVDERISESEEAGYALLQIDVRKKTVHTKIFSDKDDYDLMQREYIDAETEASKTKGLIVALVSSNMISGVRDAYPNYFADSTEFLNHLSVVQAVEY